MIVGRNRRQMPTARSGKQGRKSLIWDAGAADLSGDLIGNGDDGVPRAKLPEFFLFSLHVQNFRAIDEATFTFQPALNVIIGANNAAKTAAIDALRIVFSQGSYEKREDPIRLR